jgi:hypothetical protein
MYTILRAFILLLKRAAMSVVSEEAKQQTFVSKLLFHTFVIEVMKVTLTTKFTMSNAVRERLQVVNPMV